MFNPMGMLDRFALDPRGAEGLNTVRGALGGLLSGIGTLMVLGLLRKNPTWFLAAAVMLSTVLIGRLVGVAADGLAPGSRLSIVMEVVAIAVLVAASKRLVPES